MRVPRNVHLLPPRDVIQHEASEDCVCGPTPKARQWSNGFGQWWSYAHHALDPVRAWRS